MLSIRRLVKNAFLGVVATIAGLLIAELTVRVFFPQYYPINPAAYEYDSDMAFRLRPNAHLFRTTDYQQENITNALGTVNFQENFDGYESLVFALGDSFTQGTGVPADMSYPAQLDFILNQDEQGFYVKKFGVVNLGVAGFGAEQSLLNLRQSETRLGPPKTILYLGWENDFEDDLAFRSGDRHRIVSAGSPVWGHLTRPLRLVLENTHLGVLARVTYRQRVRAKMVNDALKAFQRKPTVVELEAPVLEQIRAHAETTHSRLIVSWAEETESYHWLKSWAEQHGVGFADWAPKVNSVKAGIPKLPTENPHSAGHHRGWINHYIALEFARQIHASR